MLYDLLTIYILNITEFHADLSTHSRRTAAVAAGNSKREAITTTNSQSHLNLLI